MTGRFAFGWDRCGDVSGVDLGAPLDSGTVSPARTALRAFGAATAALLLVAGLAGPALGHAELDTADPADKAVLQTPPTTITLTFTEDLDPSKSSFKLLAPDGSTVGTGGATAIRTMSLDDLSSPGRLPDQMDLRVGRRRRHRAGRAGVHRSPSRHRAPARNPRRTTWCLQPVGVERRGRDPARRASRQRPRRPHRPRQRARGSTGDVLLPIIVGLILVGVVGAFVLRRSRGA